MKRTQEGKDKEKMLRVKYLWNLLSQIFYRQTQHFQSLELLFIFNEVNIGIVDATDRMVLLMVRFQKLAQLKTYVTMKLHIEYIIAVNRITSDN